MSSSTISSETPVLLVLNVHNENTGKEKSDGTSLDYRLTLRLVAKLPRQSRVQRSKLSP
jgi:hypothetical protein